MQSKLCKPSHARGCSLLGQHRDPLLALIIAAVSLSGQLFDDGKPGTSLVLLYKTVMLPVCASSLCVCLLCARILSMTIDL